MKRILNIAHVVIFFALIIVSFGYLAGFVKELETLVRWVYLVVLFGSVNLLMIEYKREIQNIAMALVVYVIIAGSLFSFFLPPPAFFLAGYLIAIISFVFTMIHWGEPGNLFKRDSGKVVRAPKTYYGLIAFLIVLIFITFLLVSNAESNEEGIALAAVGLIVGSIRLIAEYLKRKKIN